MTLDFLKNHFILNVEKATILFGLLFFFTMMNAIARSNEVASANALSKGGSPYSELLDLLNEQGVGDGKMTVRTPISKETLQQISPLMHKALKLKNDVALDQTTNVGDVLTTLLKEKYSKKSNAKNDFLAIQYSSKISDFASYLEKYPKSKYTDEAKTRMNCLKENELLKKAQRSKDIKDYEEFAKQCAKSTVCDFEGCEVISRNTHKAALAVNDWLALTKLKKADVWKDYSNYLNKYGEDSVFSKEAADSMNYHKDRYDWSIAKKEDTITAYKEYISNHEDGSFQWQAEQKVKEYEMWEKATGSDNYKDYCAYYSDYPEGKYVNVASEKMKKEEAQLWKEITERAKDTKGLTIDGLPSWEEMAYETFIAKYPTGYYTNEAMKKLADLRLAPHLKDTPTIGKMSKLGVFSNRGYSMICLGNGDKSKTITVSLSGLTGFSKKIAPGKNVWVRVKNGSYKILVQASRTNNWWGNAIYNDGIYGDAWCTTTIINGVEISNKDENAVEQIKDKLTAKIIEEMIKTRKMANE